VSRLVVIGVAEPCLSNRQKELLEDCDFVFGTSRLKELTADISAEFYPITPLSEALQTAGSLLQRGRVAILASGDPLFYGVGRKLLQLFDDNELEFHPALSSLQRACALFKIPWDDAKIISLHGRSSDHLATSLLQASKTIVFTDTQNSPQALAQNLVGYFEELEAPTLLQDIRFLVAEDIGLATEKISRLPLRECAASNFSPLNVLCILAPFIREKSHTYSFGLTEEKIAHSRGLITKSEIRAATLHSLRLPKKGILWDVGAGSGSISIEAARSNKNLTVYAIEHKKEEIENIKNNIRRYHCFNVIPVFGRAPDILENLPAPDRIFVGGSSGALDSLVRVAAERLPAGGRIIINGVIEKTIEAAPKALKDNNFLISTSTIKVSRQSHTTTPTTFNPITIISGTR